MLLGRNSNDKNVIILANKQHTQFLKAFPLKKVKNIFLFNQC